MKLKVILLSCSILALVNCAPGRHPRASDAIAHSPAPTLPGTGGTGGSGVDYNDSTGGLGTEGPSTGTNTGRPSNPSTPTDTPQVVDGSSDMGTPPATGGGTTTTPPPTQNNNDGGLFGAIGNFFNGIFGGGGNSGQVVNNLACGILPNILNFGLSYLTGGNMFVGNLASQIANGLLKCGSQTDLAKLIPQGSSGKDFVFQVISQALQMKDSNLNIMSLVQSIQNPKDIAGIVNILTQLSQKTKDSKILDVLNTFILMQATQGQLGQSCGSMNDMACNVFNVINRVRTQAGLPQLLANNKCVMSAQNHSQDMFLQQILTHISTLGLNAKERMNQLGIGSPWAEIVVKGSTLTADRAVDIWMGSEGHRKNILSPLFQSVGVGYSNGYFTVCFN